MSISCGKTLPARLLLYRLYAFLEQSIDRAGAWHRCPCDHTGHRSMEDYRVAGSIRPGLLKWRTCARLCWARARQARPPRLRLFSFPVRPPGRGGRPRASDESARGGAMSKGEQPRALRQSLQKSFATRWPPGRGDFSFGDFSHAPSPKNLSKNVSAPQKGVAFLTKDVFEKNF